MQIRRSAIDSALCQHMCDVANAYVRYVCTKVWRMEPHDCFHSVEISVTANQSHSLSVLSLSLSLSLSLCVATPHQPHYVDGHLPTLLSRRKLRQTKFFCSLLPAILSEGVSVYEGWGMGENRKRLLARANPIHNRTSMDKSVAMLCPIPPPAINSGPFA